MERRKSPYSIHKRPTKRKNRHVYYARFRNDVGGYNNAISTGCFNRDDAVRWCEKRLVEVRERETSLTLKEFAEGFWKPSGSYAEGRIAHGFTLSAGTLYVANLITKKHVIPKWGACRLRDLTSGKLDAWIVQLHKNGELSPASINHILQAMRTILGQATSEGLINENPASFVKPVKLVQTQRGILTLEEVRKLLASYSIWRNQTHFVLNLVAACTGARMGELRALQVQNVFPDHIEIRQSWEDHSGLKDPKWGSARSIPIAATIFTRLTELVAGADSDAFVFRGSDRQNTPLGKHSIEDALYEAMKAIGINDKERRDRRLSFHGWRHWLNTALRSRGLPDSKLRLITGHRSEAMSDRYTHYQASDLSEVVELQNGLVGNLTLELSSTRHKQRASGHNPNGAHASKSLRK